MSASDKTKPQINTQVPGQFLGYGLQYRRMLGLLLESHGSAVVSLEVFEDVGAQDKTGTIASQTKSSTTKNPVSNRAEPLWKTLWNWLQAVSAGQLSLDGTLFELYVFGNFEGEICSRFSEASSEEEAKLAISQAKELLSREKIPLPAHIKRVLAANLDVLLPLIVRFRYRHGSGSSVDDIREQLSATFIPGEFLDHTLKYSEGWVKQQVDALLEQQLPAAIEVAHFRHEISSYIRSLAFSACLADLAGPVLPHEIEGSRSRIYVRQLDLIESDGERKLRAISAYLRSSANRSKWGELGMVHDQSWNDFQERLVSFWKNSRIQTDIALERASEVSRGQFLLAECMKSSPLLQGSPVPHDFAEGCFHSLADVLTIGWHPKFETLTKGWN